MENQDTSITIKSALPNAANKKATAGTNITQPQLDRVTHQQDVAKLRAKTHQTRVDATKNLEMIRERLKEISASLNEDMNIRSKSLKFSVDDSTNRMLVKVLDKESGELIRQIPSEAILKVAHSLEALKGILFDDKY